LRDILIEGNNLLPWREPTTDLDELKKELAIYAGKQHSKNPGGGLSEYAFDIVRRIRLYRDEEALIEIEKETTPDTQTPVTYPEISNFVSSIAGYYPKFIKHYPELVKAEYIKTKDTGLHWLKSKQSLAEYFSAIKPKDKSNNRTVLENIFGMKNLRMRQARTGIHSRTKSQRTLKHCKEQSPYNHAVVINNYVSCPR
jgi:hypothetical protein